MKTLPLYSFFCLLLLSCDSSPKPPSITGVIRIATTFYPLTEFARTIGGEEVQVTCYLPEGEDPIFWTPSKEVIKQYQESDLIVINGAHFEKWVALTALPLKKIINTAKPFEKQWISFENATSHSHGSKGEHTHEGVDGHTWVSPAFAEIQAKEILKALTSLRPEKKNFFETRFHSLQKQLQELDLQLKELGQKSQGKTLLASHPAYNYLGISYGFKFQNFDFDPDELPNEKALQPLTAYLKKTPASFLIWESFPAPKVEQFFKEKYQLTSVEFSPLEGLSENEQKEGKNFMDSMKTNITQLAKILETP